MLGTLKNLVANLKCTKDVCGNLMWVAYNRFSESNGSEPIASRYVHT